MRNSSRIRELSFAQFGLNDSFEFKTDLFCKALNDCVDVGRRLEVEIYRYIRAIETGVDQH